MSYYYGMLSCKLEEQKSNINLCHVLFFSFLFTKSKCVLCIVVSVFLSNNQRSFQSLFHLRENKLLAFSQFYVINIVRTVYAMTLFCTHIQEK